MDFMIPEDIKTLVDIGLGAVSLMLWFRQGKTNDKQSQALEGINTMVRDHDNRIQWLESSPGSLRRKRDKKR